MVASAGTLVGEAGTSPPGSRPGQRFDGGDEAALTQLSGNAAIRVRFAIGCLPEWRTGLTACRQRKTDFVWFAPWALNTIFFTPEGCQQEMCKACFTYSALLMFVDLD